MTQFLLINRGFNSKKIIKDMLKSNKNLEAVSNLQFKNGECFYWEISAMGDSDHGKKTPDVQGDFGWSTIRESSYCAHERTSTINHLLLHIQINLQNISRI